MQKIRDQVLLRRDKVYQDNEGEVRKRWSYEDAVSFCRILSIPFCLSFCAPLLYFILFLNLILFIFNYSFACILYLIPFSGITLFFCYLVVFIFTVLVFYSLFFCFFPV